MEPQTKIAKTRSILDLPEGIAHTILCLLDTKDIARVCTVCKSLRRLCFGIPSLSLCIQEFQDESQVSDFSYFLHTLLGERHEIVLDSLYVQSFCPKFNSSKRCYIKKVLYDAVRLSVQKLSLVLHQTDMFRLPPFVFNCTRVVELNLHNGFLVLPNVQLGTVQELSLSSFRMIEGVSLGGWISSCGKAIKKLELLHFDGIEYLDIVQSSLETLRINCYVDCLNSVKLSATKLKTLVLWWKRSRTSSSAKSFAISAPNLSRLDYASTVSQWSVLGELTLLRTVNIFSESPPYLSDRRANIFNILSHQNVIRTMMLSAALINELYEHNNGQSMSWKDLKFLYVYFLHTKHFECFKITALASFLKASPNLRTLKIMRPRDDLKDARNKVYGEKDVGCFGADDVLRIDELENLFMKGFQGDGIEMELLRNFLKHGKALKSIQVLHYLESSEAEKIITKLKSFAKASSKVSFKFARGC